MRSARLAGDQRIFEIYFTDSELLASMGPNSHRASHEVLRRPSPSTRVFGGPAMTPWSHASDHLEPRPRVIAGRWAHDPGVMSPLL